MEDHGSVVTMLTGFGYFLPLMLIGFGFYLRRHKTFLLLWPAWLVGVAVNVGYLVDWHEHPDDGNGGTSWAMLVLYTLIICGVSLVCLVVARFTTFLED